MGEDPALVPVYLFHGQIAGETYVMCAAPIDAVTAVFGGGGNYGMDSVARSFGGCAYFQNDATGAAYLAVWGSRNASRFRGELRRSGAKLEVKPEAPNARLAARITH